MIKNFMKYSRMCICTLYYTVYMVKIQKCTNRIGAHTRVKCTFNSNVEAQDQEKDLIPDYSSMVTLCPIGSGGIIWQMISVNRGKPSRTDMKSI